MNELVNRYLNKMLEFEEAGYVKEALELAEKVLVAFPDDRLPVIIEKAKLEFRNHLDRQALFDFIKAYELSGDSEIYQLILSAYYIPNETVFRGNLQKNRELLKGYLHYRNEYDDGKPEVFPVWQDEELLVYADGNREQFKICRRTAKGEIPASEQAVLLANELWPEDILMCEAKTVMSEHFLDMDLPVYLFFDKTCWEVFMQLHALTPLLQKSRMVFLVGRQSFCDYFSEDMVIFPSSYFISENIKELESALTRTEMNYKREMKENINRINCYYYKSGKERIKAGIKSRIPRILFIVSRFTTVLRYHTRDCMEAAKRLGCETKLLMEQDGFHRINAGALYKAMAEFHPDMVFSIDHFRYTKPESFPENVVYITWVQDPMSHIMSKETPLKLTDRDFVMNHYISWKKFQEVGYSEKCLIEAPIPANSYIYKPYQLSEEEREQYSCDICFVCHASDVDGHIEELLRRIPELLWETVCAAYKGYQSYVSETGKFLYKQELFAEYIQETFDSYQIAVTSEQLNFFAEDMYEWFNQRVFRQTLVDWILDAGFTDIKLWGNGWKSADKYKGYAMGPAENGEILSKIYQASKIVIGNNIHTTGAARVWETMLSGGFYLSNYIPEEDDAVDIRKIIEVDKDVVMFYDRDDLIKKLHYYLEHEEERQEMIKRGREAALAKMTYDSLMKRVLKEVAERLEEKEREK